MGNRVRLIASTFAILSVVIALTSANPYAQAGGTGGLSTTKTITATYPVATVIPIATITSHTTVTKTSVTPTPYTTVTVTTSTVVTERVITNYTLTTTFVWFTIGPTDTYTYLTTLTSTKASLLTSVATFTTLAMVTLRTTVTTSTATRTITTVIPIAQTPTTLSLYCAPLSVPAGKHVTCAAIVSSPGSSPRGYVSWTASNTSLTSHNLTCYLTTNNAGYGSCDVRFTAASPGTVEITAVYPQQPPYLSSAGSLLVTITNRSKS